jgi:hypothetical protein
MNTTRFHSMRLVLAGAGMAVAACQQQSAQSQSTWSEPLPDLNTVEECQKADLGRYWGSTFRFHRDGCWANVTFDERGRVTAFEPEDAAVCQQVLATCG